MKEKLFVNSLGLILFFPRGNIWYTRIVDRQQKFNMATSGVQFYCFYLASNLHSLKLLDNYHVITLSFSQCQNC